MLPGFRSMDDALLVGVAEPVADLLHHVELVVERQLSLGCDDVLEIVALQELHRHEELAVVLAELVHGHDVRVVELSRRLRLAHESRPKHVFLIQGRGDELDRHVAVQHRVVTSVDGAHRAAAQPVDDRVLPDFGGLVRASGGGLVAGAWIVARSLRVRLADSRRSRPRSTGKDLGSRHFRLMEQIGEVFPPPGLRAAVAPTRLKRNLFQPRLQRHRGLGPRVGPLGEARHHARL